MINKLEIGQAVRVNGCEPSYDLHSKIGVIVGYEPICDYLFDYIIRIPSMENEECIVTEYGVDKLPLRVC